MTIDWGVAVQAALAATVTGVDVRADMVKLCAEIAARSGFDRLFFEAALAGNAKASVRDVIIALHACDTATDDALFQGIRANADLIVAAPCCHKQIRKQMKPPPMMNDILKHGVMIERVAETLTDGLRSLLLERSGYSTKLFEFVALEHTPKNNMLVGTRLKKPTEPEQFEQQIAEIKAFYGIEKQHLETLLKKSDPT